MDQKKYFTTASIVSSNRVLYTPSAFARSSLLHLQEIGTLQALAPHTSSRSNLQSYLFFTVISGSGTLIYDGKKYDLKKGDMVFIDCRKPYSHTTDLNLWSLRWCHFYGPTLSFVYEKYVERGGRPTFRPEETASFLSTLDSLYKLASGSDYIRDMRINEELNRLCTLLMEQSWNPEEATTAPKKLSVAEVKEYLEQHYAEKITLDDLSKQFFINKYYLTRVFRNQYGCSIDQYLMQKRITYAKEQLRFTDKTLEVIAGECGLTDAAYLSRVFRKIEKINPGAYRSTWR